MPNLFIKNDLTPLLKLAVPLALTGVIQSASFFFQTIFLAHLDQEILAAGALVSWLFATLIVIMFGVLGSINILVAHKHGAKDHNAVALIVRDGLFLSLLTTIPAVLLLWNMSPIFLLFGQSSSIVRLSEAYLHALAWGMLPNLIVISILECIIGLGHTRVIMIFAILTVFLNILFSYLFIFGKLGLPALSIAGAGWGMTISNWVTALILCTYIACSHRYRGYFRHLFTFNRPSYLGELIQIGLPMGLMYCIEVGFFFALTLLMGSLSGELMAANQIAMQYLGSLMGIIFSIAQAITVRMGHLIGAGQPRAAERAGYVGIYISGTLMTLIALIYWFYPALLISVDLNLSDPKNFSLIREVKALLVVAALFQIFEAIRISFFGALRSVKDTKFTLLTSAVSFWLIALPLGYLMATYYHRGGAGLWYGMTFGAIISVALLFWRFKVKMQRVIRRSERTL